ncbi:MAG TPA: tripartite tricarboxylate transporter TctB family protein [Usitatibacter sp.]|nr:tripartite tricarboxylate transporter TctB family protein [Usitatibacter sp.]
MQDGQQDRAVGSFRVWEALVAILFIIFGSIVVFDSRRLGASWGSDGPQAGYFPFYIGVVIIIASAFNLYGAFSRAEYARKAFVYRGQLKMVLTVMVPSIAYVALINNPVYSLGIYEASIVFIAFFMRVLGKYGWAKIVAVSVGVMTAFFLMFEVWFKVPLPKGPIEALLGFR